MKSIVKSALLAFSGTALLAAPAMAVATNNGDLLLAFYQVSADGTTVENNTYVVNLGQASIWRENTQVGVSLSAVNPGLASSNIGAELTQAFGLNWANSGTVRWGLVGGLDQTTSGLVGGERGQTSYISASASNPGLGNGPSSSQPLVTGASRNTLRNSIESFRRGSNGTGTDIGNDAGALITVNLPDTFEDFLPPTSGAQFGIGIDILQAFNAGDINGLEGALDIWRLVGGTSTADLNGSGTDLTSGLGSGNAVLGQGQYIGTITIDSAGNLSIVPEASTTMMLGFFGILGLTRRNRKNA